LLLAAGAVFTCATLGLLSMQSGTRKKPGMDPAAALIKARRVSRPDDAASLPMASEPSRGEKMMNMSFKAEKSERVSGPAIATTPHHLNAGRKDCARDCGPATATALAAGCASERRPFHTVLTSSSGTYQAWQCRIMYHHYKLQQAVDPCGEMGALTRLLTTWNGLGDHLMEEIPTIVVKEMSSFGYVVVNRPHSMVQLLQHPKFMERIVEEYVYIAETDHILLRPLPNLATASTPAAFNFGYMVPWGQAKIVDKFVPGLGGKTDPVGPSPVIIHIEQFKKVVQPWFDFTIRIMKDHEAVQALGWVREMWGYCIAAASLGIQHRVLDAFQFEGGSIGNRERRLAWPVLPTPVTPDRFDMPYYVFHYTYGVEYSREGLPMELQVGEWSLDKRHYMGSAPPRQLVAPPACAHDRAHVLRALYNNASASIASWPGGGQQLDMFRRVQLRSEASEYWSHPTSAGLLGTGPWLFAGATPHGAYRLEKVWFLAHGWMHSSKGYGRWQPASESAVTIEICNMRLTVTTATGEGEWALLAEGKEIARLKAKPVEVKVWQTTVAEMPSSNLGRRVTATGPYQGSRSGWLMLLRGGVLQAIGKYQQYGHWREVAGVPESIELIGAGKPVQVFFADCFVMRIPEEVSIPTSAEALTPPPKYGAGVAANNAEWILRPPASTCKDVCTGFTLRKLTPEDRAGSTLARAIENCCNMAWAGFGGMRFLSNGALETPWGSGTWGAPPEAQGRHPKLLAEFAGSKHMLTLTTGLGEERIALQSYRCSDNDPAVVTMVSGSPRWHAESTN